MSFKDYLEWGLNVSLVISGFGVSAYLFALTIPTRFLQRMEGSKTFSKFLTFFRKTLFFSLVYVSITAVLYLLSGAKAISPIIEKEEFALYVNGVFYAWCLLGALFIRRWFKLGRAMSIATRMTRDAN